MPFKERDSYHFISVGLDCVTILHKHQTNIFFMLGEKAKKINPLIQDKFIRINEHSVSLYKILDLTPGFYGCAINSVEDYIDLLYKSLKDYLKNKKIVVWYSGGKDSTSLLVVILKLSELIRFKPYFVYLHVPYLDGQRNIKFVEKVEKKLSIDIIYDSIEKNKMLDLIKKRGLPFRGYRWCTYHAKIKIMRKIKRSLGVDLEARSERATESQKRFKSLKEYAKQRMFISGTQFKPIYPLTILDVVRICKEYNLIHPDYFLGCTRVSCSLCPYRSILEIKSTFSDVEDHHFIDSILKEMYEKWYNTISLEIYNSYYLWRFSPGLAKEIILLKTAAEKLSTEQILSDNILDMTSWIWKNKIDAPVLGLEKIYNYILGKKLLDSQILNLGLKLVLNK